MRLKLPMLLMLPTSTRCVRWRNAPGRGTT
jgi:hypothetical protein